MRGRIDRFVEDALLDFRSWYVDAEWYGKERDCVNIFAFGFLPRNVQEGAAISDLTQIRVESPVPQPSRYSNPAAAKDLVVWSNSLGTVWDDDWKAVHWPRVVMEWKFRRKGNPPRQFDSHDLEWLCAYTAEYEDTFGYVVRVYDGPQGRCLDWAKVVRGALNETNRRS